MDQFQIFEKVQLENLLFINKAFCDFFPRYTLPFVKQRLLI